MSIGDIVRLNRMYKCGPPYLTTIPENVKNLTNGALPKTERNELHNDPVPISQEPVTATTTVSTKPNRMPNASNRTIFGVLIFKSIE